MYGVAASTFFKIKNVMQKRQRFSYFLTIRPLLPLSDILFLFVVVVVLPVMANKGEYKRLCLWCSWYSR